MRDSWIIAALYGKDILTNPGFHYKIGDPSKLLPVITIQYKGINKVIPSTSGMMELGKLNTLRDRNITGVPQTFGSGDLSNEVMVGGDKGVLSSLEDT